MRRLTTSISRAFSTITHIRGSIYYSSQSPASSTLARSNSEASTSSPRLPTVPPSSSSPKSSTRPKTGSSSSPTPPTKYSPIDPDHPPAQRLHPLPPQLRQLRPHRPLRLGVVRKYSSINIQTMSPASCTSTKLVPPHSEATGSVERSPLLLPATTMTMSAATLDLTPPP